jgi:hypothetical protein
MPLHPEQRRVVLEGLVTGDLDPSSPEVEQAFRDDPTLAEEWLEFAAFRADFDPDGAEERGAIAEASNSRPDGPRADAIERLVVTRLTTPSAGSGARRRPRLLRLLPVVAAAAATVILAMAVWWANRPSEPARPDRPEFLGDPPAVPSGTANEDEGVVYRWQDDAALDTVFVVEIYDADDPDAREPALRTELVDDLTRREGTIEWRPTDEVVATLPRHHTWIVTYQTRTGEPGLASGTKTLD